MKADFGGWGHNDKWVTVNIDKGTAHDAPDIVADITYAARQLERHFAPQSLEEVQCIATMEHLYPHDMLDTLRYWRGFMQPNARLLIVVPDMPRICADYVAGRIPDNTFAGMIYGHPDWQRMAAGEAHHWGFSLDTLTTLLCMAGYHDVRATEWDGVGWVVDDIHMHDLVVEAFA